MNRFTAILGHGIARLAFWRKPVETTPESPPPPAQPESLDPAAARRVRASEAESSAPVDVPVLRVGWFARLKHVLRRRSKPVQEPSPDPDQTVARSRPSPESVDASAAADDGSPPALSFLARLKNKLRHQPQPEQLQAEALAEEPGAEKDNKATATSDVDPADDADATRASLMGRVLALLTNQWVWIPGISTVLLASMTTMMLMLLQSTQEKEHLQTKLVAAQKELKQTTIEKQAAVRRVAFRQAGDSANSADETQQGVDAGDCVVSDQASVIKNLKNCIESFNSAMAE